MNEKTFRTSPQPQRHGATPSALPAEAPMDPRELAFTGAAEQARLLATGEISARGLVKIYLPFARLDARLHSYRTVLAESARREADAAQDRLDAGERLPLLGTLSSRLERLHPDFIAADDHVVVADTFAALGSMTKSSSRTAAWTASKIPSYSPRCSSPFAGMRATQVWRTVQRVGAPAGRQPTKTRPMARAIYNR